MKLNVIIPAYNEEERIGVTLKSLQLFLLVFKKDIEVTVVNDGSTDKTVEVLNHLKKDLPLNIINLKTNFGKGAAIKAGILQSRKADLYYLADADLATSWFSLLNLITAYNNYSADIVLGSRAVHPSGTKISFKRRIAGKFGNILIQLVTGLRLRDTQTGYKLMNYKASRIFEELEMEGWSFDIEFLYKAQKAGFVIKETHIEWEDKAGSKLRLFDYFRVLKDLFIIRYR